MNPMTRPEDAPLIAALQYQHHELELLLARVERMRCELVPPPTAAWRGSARRAFSTGMQGIASAVDSAEESLRSAHGHTGVALMEVGLRV
jgi:hypothetical protein